jgi:transposase
MATPKYKTRIRYTLKFRQQIVDLVRAGRPIPELVQQFGCTAVTIRNWLRLARKQDGKPASAELTINERAELEWLRREHRQLLMEREVLSKTAAWFAQEAHPSSKRSSDS